MIRLLYFTTITRPAKTIMRIIISTREELPALRQNTIQQDTVCESWKKALRLNPEVITLTRRARDDILNVRFDEFTNLKEIYNFPVEQLHLLAGLSLDVVDITGSSRAQKSQTSNAAPESQTANAAQESQIDNAVQESQTSNAAPLMIKHIHTTRLFDQLPANITSLELDMDFSRDRKGPCAIVERPLLDIIHERFPALKHLEIHNVLEEPNAVLGLESLTVAKLRQKQTTGQFVSWYVKPATSIPSWFKTKLPKLRTLTFRDQSILPSDLIDLATTASDLTIIVPSGKVVIADRIEIYQKSLTLKKLTTEQRVVFHVEKLVLDSASPSYADIISAHPELINVPVTVIASAIVDKATSTGPLPIDSVDNAPVDNGQASNVPVYEFIAKTPTTITIPAGTRKFVYDPIEPNKPGVVDAFPESLKTIKIRNTLCTTAQFGDDTGLLYKTKDPHTIPGIIAILPDVETLHITGNKIRADDINLILNRCKSLVNLVIRGCEGNSGIATNALASLEPLCSTTLRHLKVSGVQDLSKASLLGLVNLETLEAYVNEEVQEFDYADRFVRTFRHIVPVNEIDIPRCVIIKSTVAPGATYHEMLADVETANCGSFGPLDTYAEYDAFDEDFHERRLHDLNQPTKPKTRRLDSTKTVNPEDIVARVNSRDDPEECLHSRNLLAEVAN